MKKRSKRSSVGKIIITVTVLSVAGYTTMFFYSPESKEKATTNMVEGVQEVITTPEPQKSPVERAREELETATQRLADEEEKLLAQIGTATTTASHAIEALKAQIAQIESERDVEVARLEDKIAEIHSLLTSF